ncbi:hypothetical protein KJ785_03450 [Patescibacteria group bacterium]|nr:hypothetical protein [Patescibacteria group bacterium]
MEGHEGKNIDAIVGEQTKKDNSKKESNETPEYIPTPEEVLSIFERLLEGKQYKTDRRLEDEKGLYLWTIKIDNENDEGYTEYEYMRKAKNPQPNFIVIPYIYKASYDETGFPEGGHSVAKCVDGEWKITP